MNNVRGLCTLLVSLMILTIGASSGAAGPEGQMTSALHFSPTPVWFDPAEPGSRHGAELGRVVERVPGWALVAGYIYSAPYEDVKLKSQ